MNEVFIALGSNLDQPLNQIRQAVEKLQNFAHFRMSSIYKSPPYGVTDQPDFYNACAFFKTDLTAYQLLDYLKNIEQEQGRVFKRRWGERCIDLDILLFNQQCITSEHLNIPHKDMLNRPFVILPLYEIAPNLILYHNGSFSLPITELALQFSPHNLIKIKELP